MTFTGVATARDMVGRILCSDCRHLFVECEGHQDITRYTDGSEWIELQCPKCRSPHILDYPLDAIDAMNFPELVKFEIPERITVRPVNTDALEEQARRMIERLAVES
jgi:hypothetical protein